MAVAPNMAAAPKAPSLVTRFSSGSRPPRALILRMSSQQHWSSTSLAVTTHVLKSLPADLHPSVAAPIRHLLSAAPPTIAPALCLAACCLVGGRREQALDAACCVQLMHVALHAHGRLLGPPEPEAAARTHPGIELMTADGILPFGYEMMSRAEGGYEPDRVLRAVVEVAKATGAGGVLEGQLMEVEGAAEGAWVRERKEGRMLSCSAACGAILGGGSEEEVERLRRFGLYVAMMGGGSGDAAAETFRSLARLELRMFDRERVEEVQVLVDSWWSWCR